MVIGSLRRRPELSLQRQRLVLLVAGSLAWTLLIGGRLLQLQVLEHEELRRRALGQQTSEIEVPAQRGAIHARNGEVLATSIGLTAIYAHPHLLADPDAAAVALAPALERPIEQLRAALSSRRTFVYLRRAAPPAVARAVRDAIRRAGLTRAVGMHPDSRRYYPHRTLAAHVLGFVDGDQRGRAGIEYYYDELIRGTPGKMHLLRDGSHRVLARRDAATAPRPGRDLVLTLDWSLQFAAESALADAVRRSGASGGTVVALDPRTGAVLALAAYPGYNPNDRGSEAFRNHQVNRAVSWQFEPGSVFKVITAAAALHEGVVQEDEPIDCHGGVLALTDRIVIRDWRPGFGVMSFRDVLARSSNVGTIQVCQRIPPDTYYTWLRDFGFGQTTGIDLPFEKTGRLPPPERWSARTQATMAFGQEIAVTPVQLATAVAAIANGGTLVVPHLLAAVRDADGGIIERVSVGHREVRLGATEVRRRVLRPDIARRVRAMMEYVVTNGTGAAAAIPGYRIAGKTSTAEKYDPEARAYNKYVAGFVGFLPVQDPEIVILVVVDEPRRGFHHGSEAAAPAFREIARAALRVLRIPPDRNGRGAEWVTAGTTPRVPPPPGARTTDGTSSP